ncbi:MAG: acyl carrier protein [Oscillospiraceae bacterium]|nr:acyl carrier protein [Oscillospiraceae bacterium]MBQ4486737.1 acyl carrier protein [Oscillospiraceae bacterium]MCR5806345.1 acyl carrier protein [Oscillospiraceae bacterium]
MIFDKVKELVVDILSADADDVTLNTDIANDLGADSLDVVDLIQAIEDEFGVDIPDEDAQKIKTIGDIVQYVEDHQE